MPGDCGGEPTEANVPNSEISGEGFVIHDVTSITFGRDPDIGGYYGPPSPYINNSSVAYSTATGAGSRLPQYRTVIYTLTDDMDVSFGGSF